MQQLKPRLETAQKKETDEMMDKLKGLGNSLLGMLLRLIILLFQTHVVQAILGYLLTILNSNLTDKEVIQSTFRASILLSEKTLTIR